MSAIRILKNISGADLILNDFNGMTLEPDESVNGLLFGDSRLRNSADVLKAFLDGMLEASDGTYTYTGQPAVDLVKGAVDQFTKDGKKIFTTSDRPQDHYRYFTTCGDDVASQKRGGGTCLLYDVAPGQSQSIDVEFMDDVYLKDGSMLYSSAAMGSWLRVDVICPAGSIYPTRDSDGNVDIVNGMPVPNENGTGVYRLATEDVTVHRFINHMAMYAVDRERENIDTAEPNFIPHSWRIRCTIKNNGDTPLPACITLGMYRKITL